MNQLKKAAGICGFFCVARFSTGGMERPVLEDVSSSFKVATAGERT
jgi:hypothetical protein